MARIWADHCYEPYSYKLQIIFQAKNVLYVRVEAFHSYTFQV